MGAESSPKIVIVDESPIRAAILQERIKPILDLCVSRFNAFAKLQDELDRTKNALEERKVIDRAKGILMKLKGLTEEEAYVLMRSTAMREKKKIGEIAQSILTASELLK